MAEWRNNWKKICFIIFSPTFQDRVFGKLNIFLIFYLNVYIIRLSSNDMSDAGLHLEEFSSLRC